jgi:hypothetical protein
MGFQRGPPESCRVLTTPGQRFPQARSNFAHAVRAASALVAWPCAGISGRSTGPPRSGFSADGRLAFVASQKVPQVEVIHVDYDTQGRSRPTSKVVVDISAQDPAGFTPFLKRERARAVRAILAHLGAAAPDRPGPAPPEPAPPRCSSRVGRARCSSSGPTPQGGERLSLRIRGVCADLVAWPGTGRRGRPVGLTPRPAQARLAPLPGRARHALSPVPAGEPSGRALLPGVRRPPRASLPRVRHGQSAWCQVLQALRRTARAGHRRSARTASCIRSCPALGEQPR